MDVIKELEEIRQMIRDEYAPKECHERTSERQAQMDRECEFLLCHLERANDEPDFETYAIRVIRELVKTAGERGSSMRMMNNLARRLLDERKNVN
jgi:hypothetical protein